jgi:hypothetical protein
MAAGFRGYSKMEIPRLEDPYCTRVTSALIT